MKTLLELDIGHECRWPVATDEYGRHQFCAHATPPLGVYCAEHEAMARNPTPEFEDSKARADALGGGKAKNPGHEGKLDHARPLDAAFACHRAVLVDSTRSDVGRFMFRYRTLGR